MRYADGEGRRCVDVSQIIVLCERAMNLNVRSVEILLNCYELFWVSRFFVSKCIATRL